MKKVTILFVLLLFAVSQSAFAQSTIFGKVVDAENGSGIPGVSVIIKGTIRGTTTDIVGNFALLNVPNDATIVVSFIGYKTVEMSIGNQTRFDIMLQQDVQVLGDVVVTDTRAIPPERAVITALGIVRDKKTLTVSIQTISGDELRRAGDINPIASIDGKIAGVMVRKAGGTEAGPSNLLHVSIRGQKSFTSVSSPLLVVDGIPMGNFSDRSASWLDPNEIESIIVLKSANAAILYGSAGANGAILITLKKR